MLYRIGRNLFLQHPRLMTGVVGAIARRVPVGLRYGRRYRATRRLLRRSERWDRAQLEAYQLARLREQIEFAWREIPYYRDSFRAHGVDPSRLRCLDDIRRFPTTDKRALLHQQDRLLPAGIDRRRLMSFISGGTSGSQIVWCFTEGFRQREQAFIWHMWDRVGYRPGQQSAILQGRVCPPDLNDGLWYRDRFANAIVLSAHRLTRETAPRYLAALEAHRPRVFVAFPSLAFLLAGYAREIGWSAKVFDLVLCGSETLYPHQRRLIEATFQAPVRIHYGHTESCALFTYCRESNDYHYQMEYGLVELLTDTREPAAPGETAEIVATCFENFAMPLIRYRTEDLAVAGDGGTCRHCRLPYPLLGEVHGRTSEFIRTPSGKTHSPIMLEYVVDYHDGFADLQLVQDRIDHVTVKVVRGHDFRQPVLDHFTGLLQDRLGADMSLSVQIVDAIPRTKQQKKSLVVSRLSDDGLANGPR